MRVRTCKVEGCSNLPLFKGNKQLIYCEEHRDKVFVRRNKDFSRKQKEAIYAKCHGICSVCRTFVDKKDAEYHHKVQLSNGGANSIRNGDLMHKKCHKNNYSRLHDLSVLHWEAEYVEISEEEYADLLKRSQGLTEDIEEK